MKLQLISDLHIDVNRRHPLKLDAQDDNTVVLIAGDTSGTPSESVKWIRNNVKRGIVITGNHICYNSLHRTYRSLRKSYARAFPIDNDITYLDEDVGLVAKDIGENVMVVGTCFYTNFQLKTEYNRSGDIGINKNRAVRGMNDYRFGITKKVKTDISQLSFEGYMSRRTSDDYDYTKVTPDDYIEWHEKSVKAMTEVIEKNTDKKIVVLTHFCPTPKCISPTYVDSDVNASYASDYEKFIIDHPQIKLWLCGHVHHRDVFNVGDCKVVLNPRGYVDSFEYDCSWTPYYYVDTDTWEITSTPLSKPEKDPKLPNLAWLFM